MGEIGYFLKGKYYFDGDKERKVQNFNFLD